jgi:uncharacterized membrane protein
MTDIDRQADIELQSSDEHVIVRIPLAGQVTDGWIRCYHRLAQATDVPVQAQADPDRAWIVVSMPASSDHAEVAETMDAARTLIAEADLAAIRTHAGAHAEATIRDWWSRNRESDNRGTVSRAEVVRTGIGAEKRWILAVALAVAIAVLLLLPSRFSVGPNWIVPVVEALLLVAIFAADRGRTDSRSAVVRALSFGLVLVLVADAAFITGRLVVDLVEGGPETNSATALLRVGFGVWLYTIIAFAFLYWLVDRGGPEARIWDPPEFPGLAFPEQLNPVITPPGWRPEFFDYLYLGFTNATAFSPTDVMPLARWAKLAMTVQAIGSLAVLGLVIARAVNILK